MNIARLASSVEERGFESLWVAEHTHIPARGSEGSQLPRHYSHTLDPFVALTAAATATAKLRVGTAICQVVEREPIVTAKAVASLDVVSGGRFCSVSVLGGFGTRCEISVSIQLSGGKYYARTSWP